MFNDNNFLCYFLSKNERLCILYICICGTSHLLQNCRCNESGMIPKKFCSVYKTKKLFVNNNTYYLIHSII